MTNEDAINMLYGIQADNLNLDDAYTKDKYDALTMAIKALEQGTCEDCISRDMALEKMADHVASGNADSVEDFEEYSKIICQLPSVQPKTEWVPCSEKLPNLDDYSGTRVWHREVLITGYLSFDDTKELFVSEAFAEDVIHNSVPGGTVVTAWMPLPEPYKEG